MISPREGVPEPAGDGTEAANGDRNAATIPGDTD